MDRYDRTHQINGPLSVGYDGTGYDVTLYGDTSGKKAVWDESEDSWEVSGSSKLGDGGTTNYATFDSNGAMVAAGNARFYREIRIGPHEWDITGSGAAEGQMNSQFRTLLLTPTETASTTENLYAFVPAPNDIDTSACMRATVFWSADTAQATQTAQFTINASHYGNGEADAGTTFAGTAAKFTAGASEANAVTSSSAMDDMDPPAVGDVMGIHFEYQSSGSSTTGSDFQFHYMAIRYTANTLGAAVA